ncbi:aromatic ring-hydroxylating dioxygenase subunit alpha [Rhodococcus sp. X156]|uniref:aromatic ring-hydroxylating oxygenase subunit alpha n=1 Tax=Rhodococcus sp. X156 TaxID=2499145 RepID=UPI000FD8C6E2|nr:aromatic ring-hydroxylating dioxygenase subunit alpha [Rhodococcus sp. X156]
MQKCDDPVVLDQWYAVCAEDELVDGVVNTRLLGAELCCGREPGGKPVVTADGSPVPVRQRYGFVWTTLGTPARDVFDIEESREPDRRYVPCGWITLRTSPGRVVENFLDMAHFPFVHTGILGGDANTEVAKYQAEIRHDVDEVWATNCRFFQPQVSAATEGAYAQLTYRVPAPYMVMLYRVSPVDPSRRDAIALFIQPIAEDLCRAQPVMYLVDPDSEHTDLLHFEQIIFLQDRIIVENQRPLLLPLEPREEIPTRADSSSVTYRRWLKSKGLRWGALPFTQVHPSKEGSR